MLLTQEAIGITQPFRGWSDQGDKPAEQEAPRKAITAGWGRLSQVRRP